MTDRERDRLLREAGVHLTRVIKALDYANATELRDRAFVLKNDLVHARREQREFVGA